MNSGELTVRRWTAPWWFLSIALVTVIQVGLLFWFGNDRPVQVLPLKAKTVVHFAPEFHRAARVASEEVPEDPTLFALVSPRGFSGAAWLTIPPFSYEIANEVEQLPEPGLLSNFLATAVPELPASRLSGIEFSGPTPPPLTQVPLPVPVVVPATQVRTDGGIAARSLMSLRGLPEMPEPILTNTVLRVAVDRSGRTVTVALLAGCGVPSADDQAIQFARQVFFTSEEESSPAEASLAFGNLIFQWYQVRWEGSSLQAATARNGL